MDHDRARLSRQEELTAQPVFATLLSEGHRVVDVHRPRLGGRRSPDFVFRLDREPMALEVVRYLDRSEAQKALSRVLLVEWAIQGRLASDARAARGKIVINLRYSVEALQAHQRRDVARDADQLATEVRTALRRRTEAPDTMVEVSTTVAWVIDAQVVVIPSEEPGAYFGIAPGLPDGIPDPDGFLNRTIAAKASQHLGHADRAILAVLGMFHDDAEDLLAAFQRWSGPVPWWRVYFVHYDATLVYQQPAQASA